MTAFPAGEQTHQAVLPQQPALESVRADTPGSRDETAHGRSGGAPDTGREHGRGETGERGTVARRRHAKSSAQAVKAAENGSGDAPAHRRAYEGGSGAARVFVLSRDGRPLMPCHPARARELLGRAVVARRVPFTIRLRDRTRSESGVKDVQLRIDPGSLGTGLVVTDEKTEADEQGAFVTVRRGLVAVELQHRGDQIRARMRQRAGYRRRRRSANRRYRAPRSLNRTRPAGWLPPALRHRVDTVVSMADRLCRYAPVAEIHVERVGFRASSEERPLAGTNVRAHLQATWDDACAYCGTTQGPWNIEHLVPRCRGGSDRLSNLVLACVSCNRAKGSTPLRSFLAHRPEQLARILQQVTSPRDDAAAMNATIEPLIASLEALGRPVRTWSGRLTKANRSRTGLCTTHTLDALSVGPLDDESGGRIVRFAEQVLVAKATGRGSYARTTPDRYGFPRLRRGRAKQHFGYVTGDLVRAVVPSGGWAGRWTGRVSVRARGQHSVTTSAGRINVSHGHLRLLQTGRRIQVWDAGRVTGRMSFEKTG
ncbi:RNA-guided endonuclease IscB [Streptomyces sp. HMX87]|uniref:RNA-guided endonuclease IscB n=1 Tax=Streptomyces sp. HMX87 TaxID=3390849 RepID=UPI003A87A283